MTISVAMATYNGARFIGAQLESLTRQTRLPDELVVTDDASTDDTAAIVERFAATAPFRTRLERNSRNLGFNGNFERAISLASGDLVFISDQDDIWYPEKIDAAAAFLEAHPGLAAAINDEDLADGDARPLGATFLGNVRKLGYADLYHVAGCCTVMRRDLAALLLPFPTVGNYDGWISQVADRLALRGVLDRPLQLYRRHGANSTETVLAEESASHWKLFRAYGLDDPRQGWAQKIAVLEACRERIHARRPEAVRLSSEARVAAALVGLDEEIDRWSRRLALLSRPRPLRAARVLQLWASGFYRGFAGGKSALKDIVRA
jgi:glycosyltransferase involved in cell wall biosynthesis